VMEIGCGWGALAEMGGREFGAHMSGVTLSTEQLSFAQERMQRFDLQHNSDLRLQNYEDLIVVSPDVGGVVRARALAKQLNCDLAIIDKRRPRANVSEVMHVIGDIEDRNCVVMDDMIDTAGTLVKAAEVLKERGAKKVYAYCTHPIFSGPAIDRIAKGDALDEVVVTNTIPLSAQAQSCQRIRQLSVAPLIAETIQRIAKGESVMSLFSDQDQLF